MTERPTASRLDDGPSAVVAPEAAICVCPASRSYRPLRRLPLALGVVLLLTGCAAGLQTSNPAYPGVKLVKVKDQYLPPGAALAALSQEDTGIIAQIPAEPTPLAASARIVLPDHDRLRPLVMQMTRPPNYGVTEWNAERLRQELHNFAALIEHSRLFATVTIVEQNDTLAPDMAGADFLIWYQVRSVSPNNTGPWIGHWLMKRAGGAAVEPVGTDPGTPAGVPRWTSFLTSLKTTVAQLGSPMAVAGSDGTRHLASGGSGVVIDAQGHILTNHHVVAGCPDLRVVDAGHRSVPASLMNSDTVNDLALLHTDRHWPTWARFRDDTQLRPGEVVVVTGFPLSGLVSSEMAVTTGSLTALAGFRGDTRQLEFSAPVQPGNSGGPVLDDSGRVIGIAEAVLNGLAVAAATGTLPENVNFAVKGTTVRDFLEANQVAVGSGGAHPVMSAAAIGELARGFTVKVECWR